MLDSNNYGSLAHEQAIKKELLIHGVFRKLTEAAFYPEHEKRTESPEYHTLRKKIIEEENIGCTICGVTHEILSNNDKKQNRKINYYQAKQMELHHFHIEWALANAIDVDKFNNLFRPHLAHLHAKCELYKSFMDNDSILAWVDHHQDNMLPLCDVHHRHPYYGIHTVSYPNWNVANLYKDDFINDIQKEISLHK